MLLSKMSLVAVCALALLVVGTNAHFCAIKYNNTDTVTAMGSLISSSLSPNASACLAAALAQAPACAYATHKNGQCYLQNQNGGIQTNSSLFCNQTGRTSFAITADCCQPNQNLTVGPFLNTATYEGGVIATVYSLNYTGCLAPCVANPKCYFVEHNSLVATCYLKNASYPVWWDYVGAKEHRTVYGVIRNKGCCQLNEPNVAGPYYNSETVGSQYRVVPSAHNPFQCPDLCKADSKCYAVTYNGGNCYFKDKNHPFWWEYCGQKPDRISWTINRGGC